METERLGRTNLVVTKLGWGSIPIQRVSEAEAVSVVQAVVDMGVNLVDSARGYTTSERRIGIALKGRDARVVLSTKSPIRNAAIYDDVKESLRQLQVQKIDIYHTHGISTFRDYEKILAPGGAYEGLRRARDEGLIDYIGLSSHSLDVLARVVEEGHFDVIMTCYSFLETKAEETVLPLARAKDIGVLVMKPFSGGVIEEAGPAMKYVLSMPGIVPIPGSETIEKTRENWNIFTGSHVLTDKDREYIEATRKECDKQFCRRCDYCQPCTEEIQIQHILNLRSFVKRGVAGGDWMRDRIEKARKCTECGTCLPRCPYQLPIPELIKANLTWYDSLPKG